MPEEVEQLTMEQLAGLKTDPEAEKLTAEGLQLPEGGYNSVPELSLNIRETGEKAQYPGRKYAHFYGFFQGKGVLEDLPEGAEPRTQRALLNPQPQGKAGFNISWEYRPHLVKPGKPDNMSKLWHQAKELYCKAVGLDKRDQVGVTDVLTFIQKYAINVRFLRGDDSEIAVAISAAKE